MSGGDARSICYSFEVRRKPVHFLSYEAHFSPTISGTRVNKKKLELRKSESWCKFHKTSHQSMTSNESTDVIPLDDCTKWLVSICKFMYQNQRTHCEHDHFKLFLKRSVSWVKPNLLEVTQIFSPHKHMEKP